MLLKDDSYRNVTSGNPMCEWGKENEAVEHFGTLLAVIYIIYC